jgi:hypothetical protein
LSTLRICAIRFGRSSAWGWSGNISAAGHLVRQRDVRRPLFLRRRLSDEYLSRCDAGKGSSSVVAACAEDQKNAKAAHHTPFISVQGGPAKMASVTDRVSIRALSSGTTKS